jgi:PQQ-dependent dehydrogenase (s-GDH family)
VPINLAGKRLPWAALLLALFVVPILAQDGPESVREGTKTFRKHVVVSGLEAPWEVTWGPDNQLWVTERAGRRVTRVDPATGARRVAVTIPEVSAPGNQQGLLGLALHPDLLLGRGADFVYVAYTYVDERRAPSRWIDDPANPFRFLYGKVVRLTYDAATQTLRDPVDLIAGLPASNDHQAMRLKIGPDRKLYLTIGDMGNNQLGNFCRPIEAQRLPTADEIGRRDYAAYVGKSLRLELDGSAPADNPRINGVVSHVYTYGHRNPQGITFGPDGTLYSTEHGPKTDDEVNVLAAGANYGWPHVAGFRDGRAYEYARWAEASTPCAQLRFSDLAIDPSVPREPESAFNRPFVDPIATMFSVPSDYEFEDPACGGVNYICWPTIGVSGVEYYEAGSSGIPGWYRVLLMPTLKRGSLYVLPLTADGQRAAGRFSRYLRSQDRFRDTAVSPDRRTIYLATDPRGLVESSAGGVTTELGTPGAIVAFTYEGEGQAVTTQPAAQRAPAAAAAPATAARAPAAPGAKPAFTAAQVERGRRAYDSHCALCHGSTMTNGTFATPLAGPYFRNVWFGRTVRALYDKSRTMPPTTPGLLPPATSADIVSYILEVNGFEPGNTELPAGGDTLAGMRIQ